MAKPTQMRPKKNCLGFIGDQCIGNDRKLTDLNKVSLNPKQRAHFLTQDQAGTNNGHTEKHHGPDT